MHDLPAWHSVMWLRTFFIVRQWGRVHVRYSPLTDCSLSLRWHLCACSNSTSCCWISFRFSGSDVCPPAAGGLGGGVDPLRGAGWPIISCWGCLCGGVSGWLVAMLPCVCVRVLCTGYVYACSGCAVEGTCVGGCAVGDVYVKKCAGERVRFQWQEPNKSTNVIS